MSERWTSKIDRDGCGPSTAEASIFRRNSFKPHLPPTITLQHTIRLSSQTRQPASNLFLSHQNNSSTPRSRLRHKSNHPPRKSAYNPPLESPNPPDHNTHTMSTPTPTTLRSLYRSLLRELPPRTSATPSPLATHLRTTFASTPPTTPLSPLTQASLSDAQSTSSQIASSSGLNGVGATKTLQQKVDEAEQLAQYLKAQRMYVTLVERYNPGMNMNEEERVRLTARRVGMDLPVDYVKE